MFFAFINLLFFIFLYYNFFNFYHITPFQLRNLKTNEVVLLFNGKISEGQIAKLSSSIKNFKFLHFFGISAAYSTPETLCVPSILLITQKEVSMSWRGDTTLSFQYLSNTEIKVSSSYSGYLYKIYGVN